MTARSLRTLGVLAVALAASTLPGITAADAAPQHTCAGAFCSTFDLAGLDALAPTQPTTAAAQPTNLQLRFTDTSPTVLSDKNQWFAKVSAVLGTSSTKGFAVTAPSTLPPGSYVAGSAATAGGCAGGMDGSGYAASCPAGSGSGLVALTGVPPLIPDAIKPATFGITNVTSSAVPGAGEVLTVNLKVTIPGVTLTEVSTSTTVAVAPATASAGPTLTMDTQPAVSGLLLPYTAADFSMNTIALNLNGLVTEGLAGPLTPPVAFVRQSTLCTSLVSTLVAQARSATVAAVQFPTTITGCPAPPALVSAVPVAGNPKAFTFTMKAPTAAVAGRAASLEWVFGDGTKASTGATTTHTYPVAEPVVAVVTTVDSAGARSAGVQIKIGTGALRAQQKTGTRIAGTLTDQATGDGLGDQEVLAYHCATTHTPIADCEAVGTSVTKPSGAFSLKIPTVKKKGTVLVSFAGTATLSATQPARFGTSRFIAVLPQPKVTLEISDKTVSRGTVVRLSGTVKPGKKGKTIRLQGFVRGKWRSVGKATVSQKGTYATTYKVKVPGQAKVKLRAVLPGTAATLVSRSKTHVIKISSGRRETFGRSDR